MFNRLSRLHLKHAARASLMTLLAVAGISAQIQLSRPKGDQPLPNPSVFANSRDEVMTVTKQMLETREIPLDKEDCSQTTGECTLISKPVVFTRGITTRSQLEHYCEVPVAAVRNWLKGRYVLNIKIAPASSTSSQVAVYARFEGMTDDLSGSEWVALPSKGELEDKLLKCIRDRVRGSDCKDEKQ